MEQTKIVLVIVSLIEDHLDRADMAHLNFNYGFAFQDGFRYKNVGGWPYNFLICIIEYKGTNMVWIR